MSIERYDFSDAVRLADFLDRRAEINPDGTAVYAKKNGVWVEKSARETRDDAAKLAKGLIGRGVAPGDRVGIHAHPSYEWLMLDEACSLAGAQSVPISELGSKGLVDYIKDDAKPIFVLGDKDLENVENIWDDGDKVSNDVLAEIKATQSLKDVASILYTSGTSAKAPKGVELTNGNFVGVVGDVLTEPAPDGLAHHLGTPDKRMLQPMTMSHILPRVVSHAVLGSEAGIGFSPNLKEIRDDLQALQPTNLVAVPELLEGVIDRAEKSAGSCIRLAMFRLAMKMAIEKSYKDERDIELWTQLGYLAMEKLVIRKVMAATGGNLEHIVVGGGALREETERKFRGMGIGIIMGGGMTETTGPTMVRRPNTGRVGSVGTVLGNTKVEIDQDVGDIELTEDQKRRGVGEMVVSGVGVAKGYLDGEQFNGKFRTGDLGWKDEEDGIYYELGARKKDILITSKGLNVSPVPIETHMKEHRFKGERLFSNVVIIAEGRPFAVALVTLNPDILETYKLSIEEAKKEPKILWEIREALAEVDKSRMSEVPIEGFKILTEDLSIENGCLTPTMKLRRWAVNERYAAEIDEAYEQTIAEKRQRKLERIT